MAIDDLNRVGSDAEFRRTSFEDATKKAEETRMALLAELEPGVTEFCADNGIERSAVEVSVTIIAIRATPEAQRDQQSKSNPPGLRLGSKKFGGQSMHMQIDEGKPMQFK